MYPIKKILISAVGLSILIPAGATLAHTTVLKKNTPTGWAAREELEGTSSISAATIAHGCSSPGADDTKPVTAMSVVWPNGPYARTVRMDSGEEIALADDMTGNAVMRPRPVQDHNVFRKIWVETGDVPEYDSHGTKNSDNRAFKYKQGKLATYLYGVIPYTASYPTFKPESCAYKLKINFAIANYCTYSRSADNRADIWAGELTEKFNDPDVVSEGFWPSVDVVRDMENNPLPADCGDGYVIAVYPSAHDIDKYLPVKGYWPASGYHKQHKKP